jgi:hypothetical protein
VLAAADQISPEHMMAKHSLFQAWICVQLQPTVVLVYLELLIQRQLRTLSLVGSSSPNRVIMVELLADLREQQVFSVSDPKLT